MIGIILLVMSVGIAYYSHRIGHMKGFREGMDHAEAIWNQEIDRLKKEEKNEGT